MKKMRKLHFWIGVIASVFVFVEALTGLYLFAAESGEHRGERPAFVRQGDQAGVAPAENISGDRGGNEAAIYAGEREKGAQNHLMRLIRGIHSGVIGLISSIGLLLLTGTGIWMSVVILLAQRRQQKGLRESVALDE